MRKDCVPHIPKIAETLNTSASYKRCLAQDREERRAVVSRRRISHQWVAAVVPCKAAAINNHSANRRAVSANPLGGRRNNDVYTELKWRDNVASCRERVVDDGGNAMLLAKSHDLLEVGHGQ